MLSKLTYFLGLGDICPLVPGCCSVDFTMDGSRVGCLLTMQP